jgi:multiple sugar transport system substrate-binding protein
MSRRTVLKLGGAAALAPTLAACGPGGAGGSGAVELTFASAKFFGKSNVAAIVDRFNASQTKIHVTYRELPPPSSSTEVHQQLVQSLSRGDGSLDVFTQDVIWIAEFAEAGWSLPLDSYVDSAALVDYFPSVIQACTYKGRLSAIPWFVECGMLYYRKDLLQEVGLRVPTTWDELASAATTLIKGGKVQSGFLWQGKQAEVLVCDLVEFVGSAGGSILGSDGKTVGIADPLAVNAVQFMYDAMDTRRISPKDLLSWSEEPSRVPFTAGQAAFLRNWSYVWPIVQDESQSQVVDRVGVAPLPAFPGGKSTGCLGGYQFGVSASSRHKDAAVDFVRWLSSPDAQLKFATQMGRAPSRASVFDNPALAQANPFMAKLKDIFTGGTPRPVTPKYAQLSLVLQSGISKALTNGNIQAALTSVKSDMVQLVA